MNCFGNPCHRSRRAPSADLLKTPCIPQGFSIPCALGKVTQSYGPLFFSPSPGLEADSLGRPKTGTTSLGRAPNRDHYR
jgi:hypothetical protein